MKKYKGAFGASLKLVAFAVSISLSGLLVVLVPGMVFAQALKGSAAVSSIKSGSGATNAETPTQRAVALFNAGKYTAADAFEPLLKGSDPRLFYYAALANERGNRGARAVQIYDYIVGHFPTSEEAKTAQLKVDAASKNGGVLPTAPVQTTTTITTVKTTSIAGGASSVVATAAPSTTSPVATSPVATSPATTSSTTTTTTTTTVKTGSRTAAWMKEAAVQKGGADHPFTAEDIARDGAAGVDQTRYPNCWFEASLASMATLPRGQRMIANMIRQVSGEKWIVRFPNDGNEYVVTRPDMIADGVSDNALWAAILECAELKKFPNNVGTEGLHRLELGLSCISGLKAETLDPSKTGDTELSSFIGGPVSARNPVVCATGFTTGLPSIVFPTHAYTIIDFDPSRSMITLRNPHGRRAHKFAPLPDDPGHLHFEQMSGGICKMDIVTFQKYFRMLARSNI